LGFKANWYWYTSGCGVTFISSGEVVSVIPTITTTYYLRAEGFCNTSSCVSILVPHISSPVQPSSTSNELFELPIFATRDMNIGAMSMILKFPKDKIEVFYPLTPLKRGNNRREEERNIEDRKEKIEDRKLKDEEGNLFYNVVGDELRVGWFADEGAVEIMAGEPVFVIRGRMTNYFRDGDVVQFKIANNPLCEFADENGKPIENVVLKTFSIVHSNSKNIENSGRTLDNDLFIFPNPAENTVNVRYNIVNYGIVNISMYNVLGEKVADVINKPSLKGNFSSEFGLSSMPSGVYTLKMTLDRCNVVVKRLIVSKN